jgi:hypothetical protein
MWNVNDVWYVTMNDREHRSSIQFYPNGPDTLAIDNVLGFNQIDERKSNEIKWE